MVECRHGRPECECGNPRSRVIKAVYYHSEVSTDRNLEGKDVVKLHLTFNNNSTVLVIDRPTAARLINQLRRALDAN